MKKNNKVLGISNHEYRKLIILIIACILCAGGISIITKNLQSFEKNQRKIIQRDQKYVLPRFSFQEIPNALSHVQDNEFLEEGPIGFDVEDIRNSSQFVKNFIGVWDPVSWYLREQFSKKTKQLLQRYKNRKKPPKKLLEILTADLNRILSQRIYQRQRFLKAKLSKETLYQLKKYPEKDPTTIEGKNELSRMNRMLLEDVYPNSIRKSSDFTTGFYYLLHKFSFLSYEDIQRQKSFRWPPKKNIASFRGKVTQLAGRLVYLERVKPRGRTAIHHGLDNMILWRAGIYDVDGKFYMLILTEIPKGVSIDEEVEFVGGFYKYWIYKTQKKSPKHLLPAYARAPIFIGRTFRVLSPQESPGSKALTWGALVFLSLFLGFIIFFAWKENIHRQKKHEDKFRRKNL